MYAGVPRIDPEIQHLHCAVWPYFDVRGFQIAVNDALLVRGFERVGNLMRDRQCLIERHCPASDPLRQILALDEFHRERAHALALVKAVNVRDVRMVSDASVCASRVNRARRSASLANESGRTLSATSRLSFVSRAR
jgi:hypothetical protein